MKYYRVLLENGKMLSGKENKIFFNPSTGMILFKYPERDEFKHITALVEWTIVIDDKFSEEIFMDGVKMAVIPEKRSHHKK